MGASLLWAGVVEAQIAPPQAIPTVESAQIIASGATVAVPVLSGESKVRLRLRNGAAYLDEETGKREASSVNARVEAEPGLYLLRAFAPGKNGGLVGQPLSLVVPGLRREAGFWLFNGSMWIPKAGGAALGNPVFVSDLRRAGKNKLPVSVPTPQLLRWQTASIDLPANASPGATPNVPSAPLSPLAGPVIGQSIAATGEMSDGLRALSNARRSNAIILNVDAAADPLLAARQLQNAARDADAVVLKFDATAPLVPQLWPLKMARRMAEESENFDLPVFADVSAGGFSDAQLLELYQNGATGFLTAPGAAEPQWVQNWDANSNWLSGAVTLEDMGVLNVNSPHLETLLANLRAGGRIPLAGQLPDEKSPRGESNMVLLDDATTEQTLRGISTAARAGNTVYLEGLPAPALYGTMGEITGTQVKSLPAPREEILTLDDPWTWGAIAGREYNVTQRVSIEIKKSMAAQIKEQKGMALEVITRPAGKLTGDLNGWLVCPVGKGRIFWMPQSFLPDAGTDLSSYYAAVAGGMQSALIELEGDRANVRVALRATQGQTSLLGLFNTGDKPAQITASLRGDAAYVLDLLSDTTVESRVIGYETKFGLTIPPNGYRWLALAATQQYFDKEREFKRVKARLK